MANSLKSRRYRSRRLNLHFVTDLRAEENCTLWLRFDDGLEGNVYLGDLVGETARELLTDAAHFQRVSFDPVSNLLTWGGGVRLDPELLYQNLASRAAMVIH